MVMMAIRKSLTEAEIIEALYDSSCSETEDVIEQPIDHEMEPESSDSEEEQGRPNVYVIALYNNIIKI